MARPSRPLDVSEVDRRTLDGLLSSGVQQVRVVLRALALRQMAAGRTASEVAPVVGFSGKAVRALARRYRDGGLERALYERPRPGKPRLLDTSTEQRIVAMVCGAPPAGQARWTVRLIVTEAVKRKIVPRLGRETVRVLLESHELKPWREKNVVSSAPRRPVSGAHGRRSGAVRTAL
jgi:putative transposase